jgi:hypothetical protein
MAISVLAKEVQSVFGNHKIKQTDLTVDTDVTFSNYGPLNSNMKI